MEDQAKFNSFFGGVNQAQRNGLDALFSASLRKCGVSYKGSSGILQNPAELMNCIGDKWNGVTILGPKTIQTAHSRLVKEQGMQELKKDCTYGGVDAEAGWLVLGFMIESISYATFWTYFQEKKVKVEGDAPDPELLPKSIKSFDLDEGKLADTHVFYLANYNELFRLVRDPTLSNTTKFGSIIASLYPYTIPYLTSKGLILSWTDTRGMDTVSMGVAKAAFKTKFALISCYLFTYAYSESDTYISQVWRRYAAMCHSASMEPVQESTMKDLLQSCNVSLNYRSGIINQSFGIVLIGPNIEDKGFSSVADLPEYKTLTSGCPHTEGARLIRDQAKLIFAKFQQASFGFGLAILEPLEAVTKQLSKVFQDEVKKMREIANIYSGADYAGLREFLPSNIEVKAYPMVIYCGLLYHGRSIVDPEKKRKWEKYNVSSVGEHVRSDRARTECKSIADRLPLPTAEYIANSVAFLQAPMIDSQIKEAGILPEEVFALCFMKKIEGAWADDYFNKVYGSDLQAALRESLTSSVQLVNKKFDKLRMDLAKIANTPTSVSVSSQLRSLESDWTRAKEDFESTVAKRSVSSVVKNHQLYAAVTNIAKPFLDATAKLIDEVQGESGPSTSGGST